MKTCTKCGHEWPATPEYFNRDKSKKDGLHSHGKKCCSLPQKRVYWNNEKDRLNSVRRTPEYKAKINKERRSEINKKYNSSEKAKERARLYKEVNRGKTNLRHLAYNKIPKNRIRKNIRNRLKKLLANRPKAYNLNVSKYLDSFITYTPEQLRMRIECQFKQGMSWGNYGMYGWHIDHKKPLCLFDVDTVEGLRNACMLSNLQPLWAYENLSKHKKFTI